MSEIKTFIESQLKDMGFPEAKIKRGIAATTCESVNQVMEWILSHDDDELTSGSDAAADPSPSTSSAPDVVPVEAAKTKTAEELAEEKRKLEEKIKERRRQREEEERQAEIERERSRRQAGNVIVQLREKVEMEERIRLAEDRKREKKEDALHKQKILDEIKRDRENLKKKSLATQYPIAAAVAESQSGKPPVPAPQPKTMTDQCRLAIKLPDGSNLQQDFNSREPLAAVKLYVQLNRKDMDQDDPYVGSFTFRLPPATLFTSEDLERPLVDLGLCPSSRLFVVRK